MWYISAIMEKGLLIAVAILVGAIVLVTYKYQEPCEKEHQC